MRMNLLITIYGSLVIAFHTKVLLIIKRLQCPTCVFEFAIILVWLQPAQQNVKTAAPLLRCANFARQGTMSTQITLVLVSSFNLISSVNFNQLAPTILDDSKKEFLEKMY